MKRKVAAAVTAKAKAAATATAAGAPVGPVGDAPPARKSRRSRRKAKSGFELTYPNCAGIDVGSASHFVSVPVDRDPLPVREFKSFTDDLFKLANWLAACGIKTVVMESTGVYWIALYELLAGRGFDVHLVNARHVKSVSGRKSDVLDCQWIRELMSYGLLKGAFRPAQEVCALRAIMRQRDRLLSDQSRQVQHMQKALAEMNIQLANVISDIVGETGQRIVRAIVAGERDRHRLAALRGDRIHASQEEIARSLEGTWRSEHLFALKQAVVLFDNYASLLAECDLELERMLKPLARHDDLSTLGKPKRRGRAKNAPRFDVRTALFRACGVDVTRIDGLDTMTALKVISQDGTRPQPVPDHQAFLLVAQPVPEHAHLRRQAAQGRREEARQPRRPGVPSGRGQHAVLQVGARCLLPAHGGAPGQRDRGQGHRAHAGTAVLQCAHQRHAIRRPRRGGRRRPLRRAHPQAPDKTRRRTRLHPSAIH